MQLVGFEPPISHLQDQRSNHYTTGMDKGWDWTPSRYPLTRISVSALTDRSMQVGFRTQRRWISACHWLRGLNIHLIEVCLHCSWYYVFQFPKCLSLIWYPLQAFERLIWGIDIWHIAKASLVPGRIRTRDLLNTRHHELYHYTTGMDKGWDWDPSRYPLPELVYLLDRQVNASRHPDIEEMAQSMSLVTRFE